MITIQEVCDRCQAVFTADSHEHNTSRAKIDVEGYEPLVIDLCENCREILFAVLISTDKQPGGDDAATGSEKPDAAPSEKRVRGKSLKGKAAQPDAPAAANPPPPAPGDDDDLNSPEALARIEAETAAKYAALCAKVKTLFDASKPVMLADFWQTCTANEIKISHIAAALSMSPTTLYNCRKDDRVYPYVQQAALQHFGFNLIGAKQSAGE